MDLHDFVVALMTVVMEKKIQRVFSKKKVNIIEIFFNNHSIYFFCLAKCYRKLEYDPETNEILESAGCLASTNKYIDQCNVRI